MFLDMFSPGNYHSYGVDDDAESVCCARIYVLKINGLPFADARSGGKEKESVADELRWFGVKSYDMWVRVCVTCVGWEMLFWTDARLRHDDTTSPLTGIEIHTHTTYTWTHSHFTCCVKDLWRFSRRCAPLSKAWMWYIALEQVMKY